MNFEYFIDLQDFGLIPYIVFIIFISLLVIQLFYYLFFYLRIAIYKRKTKEGEKKPVSIVICARNEAENLKKFLPEILMQDYPFFEVIVVNDCSSDDSLYVLNNLKKEFKNLYVTTIPEDPIFKHGKKLAITVGIKAAKYEWLLLTDADCCPVSKNWLDKMQDNFTDKNEFVLGYGGYYRSKGILNKLIRFDAFFIALQYLSFAKAKVPYMGTGRNLAYKKEVFFRNKGFASHYFIPSGDDDLFVNKCANSKKTVIELSPDSFTRSIPKTKFRNWRLQKARHFSTGKYYKTLHKILLFLEIFSRIIFFITFIALLFYGKLFELILACFAIRLIIQQIIFYKAMKKLNEFDLIFWSFIFDLIFPFLNLYFNLSKLLLKNRYSWK